MRKDVQSISLYTNEGIVSDIDSCLSLCERIGNDCIGYQMSLITNECYTF
jgi:hypothetical protein